MTKHPFRLALLAVALATPMVAAAQSQPTPANPPSGPPPSDSTRDEKRARTVDDAKDVISQPAKDVGVSKTKIPPSLLAASQDPYSLTGLDSCQRIADAARVLDAALGPDYTVGGPVDKTSTGKAVGGAVVNSLIPFRGVVREISGAAAADREFAAAAQAGFARRGFLRGVHQARGCTDVM